MSSLRPVRGTHDIVGETALRHRFVVETGREVGGALRLCRDGGAGVRVHRGVRAHARRDLGHRHQGDVQLRGPRRRARHAPARVHRRRGARADLGRARPELPDPAVHERPGVPLRAAAEGPAAPVPPDRRRAAGGGRAGGRRRGDRARPAHPRGARAGRQGDARAQHARRPREPARLSRPAGRLPRRLSGAAVRGQPAAPRAQPLAHPRQQRSGRPGGRWRARRC